MVADHVCRVFKGQISNSIGHASIFECFNGIWLVELFNIFRKIKFMIWATFPLDFSSAISYDKFELKDGG